MQGTIRRVYFLIMCFTFLEVTFAATPCNHRQSLLDRDVIDLEVPFYLRDHQITSSSSILSHLPSEVTMSGNGWCAQPQSTCTVGSEGHFLQVDFGAEIVVEAISIGSVYNDSLHVTEYYIEYGSDVNQLYCVISEESNEIIFNGVDICRDNSDEEVKNFARPVIARFIRIVPMEWEGVAPCLRLELYGCYVKECRGIDLLTPENTEFSTYSSTSTMDVWCAWLSDSSPNANMTFAEPLYLLYAVIRGNNNSYATRFSLTYKNSSGDSVNYTNVNGNSIFGLFNSGYHTLLLWTPINTSWIQLSVHDYVSRSCIGINFYGCTYSEVIDHSTAVDPTISIGTTISDMSGCLAVNTETTIATVSITSTITATPSPSAATVTIIVTQSPSPLATQCFNQQTDDSECSCNFVVISVIVVAVTVILILCIAFFVVTWKLKHRKIYDGSSNVQMINTDSGEHKNTTKTDSSSWKRHEENELRYAHNTSPLSTKNKSRSEFANPQYVSAGDQQFTVNVDDVNGQHLVDNYLTPNAIVTALKDDPTLTDNPAYVTNTSHPQLADNPAYIAIKHGPPSATTSD